MIAVCCWCSSALVQVDGAWWCSGQESCRRRQTQFASAHIHAKTKKVERWLYVPTPIQTVWHEATLIRTATRVGVGGAAGPGKSKFGRETLFWFAKQVPGLHALLLRRTHKDLDQSHLRFMPYEVSQRGGEWKSSDRMAVFKHKGEPDSIIRAGHMESDGDVQNYLSSEYDIIYPDETVTFPRDPMLELFSRARTTNPHMYKLRGLNAGGERLDGAFALCSTNPGGRGALWFRDFFVTHQVDRGEFPKYNPKRWIFFPARLEDNPYMAAGYRETLENLPEMRRRQLLEGDWNAFEGQFFGEWRAEKDGKPWHVVPDVYIEKGTEWSLGMDWGSNAPGWVGWFAHMADGHYHLAHEYKFSDQDPEEVAATIKKINIAHGIKKIRYISADPSMWNKTPRRGGESVAEACLKRGLPMRKGDNDRYNGAMRMHALLRAAPDGTPWLTVSPACPYFIRTIPSLMQDKNDPEDVDTESDDHAYDGARYWAMSRPSPTRFVKDESYKPGTIGYIREHEGQPNREGVLA